MSAAGPVGFPPGCVDVLPWEVVYPRQRRHRTKPLMLGELVVPRWVQLFLLWNVQLLGSWRHDEQREEVKWK